MKYNDKQFSVYNGKNLTVEIFGASHASEIGVKISGLDGTTFELEKLEDFLARRSAKNTAYSTKRIEKDQIIFESGFDGAKITGTVKAVIKNTEQKSTDYDNTVKIPRPSHADFVGWSKYGDGFDYRGGGKFSGRLTAPMCIAGGIIKQILEEKGIKINAYISAIAGVSGRSYSDYDTDSFHFNFSDKNFPLIDDGVREKMLAEIESARSNGDSVGGKIDCVVTGVPVGAGEYMFDSIESVISHLAFSVPAVKGIEFGSGFSITEMKGSTANDAFYYDGEKIKTKTNHNGGINGGIANGMPITFRVAVKPTPSIAIEQDSIDMQTKTNVKLKIKGRHDACIVPRAVPVIEAVAAIAVLDSLGE